MKTWHLSGHLLIVIRDLAQTLQLTDGYRVVGHIAARTAGQSVDHLHFIYLGGRTMSWPAWLTAAIPIAAGNLGQILVDAVESRQAS